MVKSLDFIEELSLGQQCGEMNRGIRKNKLTSFFDEFYKSHLSLLQFNLLFHNKNIAYNLHEQEQRKILKCYGLDKKGPRKGSYVASLFLAAGFNY